LSGLEAKRRDIRTDILEAREMRYKRIQDHFKTSESIPVILKTNTPGKFKKTNLTRLHLKIIHKLITEVYQPQSYAYEETADGLYYLYTFNEPSITLKKKMMYIENNHPIGRFIDLDVYTKEGPMNRREMNEPNRKCFLCDRDAHVCSRAKRHAQKALHQFIEEETIKYLTETLKNETVNALEKELYLDPKFGLVTPRSKGCHEDMDYETFKASIEALKPYFIKFLQVGLNTDKAEHILRPIGLDAEKVMLKATHDINTHKGIIFLFGIILPFYLEGLLKAQSFKETMQKIKAFASNLTKHDFDQINHKEHLSHGEKVYQTYGIKGIRGEISEGFPSIFAWYKKYFYNDYQKLCAIMARLDDTTIIKRKNLGTLKTVKHEMQALLEEKPWRQDYYDALSKRYLKDGISPGGAADLLAVTYFFEATDYLFE